MLSEQRQELVSSNRQLADDVQQQRQRVVELENERAKQAALMEFKRRELELESSRQHQEIEQQRQRMAQQLLEFEKQRQEMERQRLELEKQQQLIVAQQLQQRLKKEEEEQLLRQQLEEQNQQQLPFEQELQQQTPVGVQGRLNTKNDELAALRRERELLDNKRKKYKYNAALATGDKLMELNLTIKQIESAISQKDAKISKVKEEVISLQGELSSALRRGSGHGKNIVSLVFSYFTVFNYSSFRPIAWMRRAARRRPRRTRSAPLM